MSTDDGVFKEQFVQGETVMAPVAWERGSGMGGGQFPVLSLLVSEDV